MSSISLMFVRLIRLPLDGIIAFTELLVSRRGLPLFFLALAAFLTLRVGWIRPPMSPDIGAFSIPLNVLSDEKTGSAEQILDGESIPALASVGLVLLLLIGLGALLVIWRPGWIYISAGLLLCGALVANSVAAFNHPALIELLDLEFEQREQMAGALAMTEQNVMVSPDNRRVNALPAEDSQRADLVRGPVYLLYGRWLIPYACVGILLGCQAPLRKRLTWLFAWSSLALALAVACCFSRFAAEYNWIQAKYLEAEWKIPEARQALHRALTFCPQLDRLERTWLLEGKLDFRQKHSSKFARFFEIYQYAREKQQGRTVAHIQDLPWEIVQPLGPSSGLLITPLGSRKSLINAAIHKAGSQGRQATLNTLASLDLATLPWLVTDEPLITSEQLLVPSANLLQTYQDPLARNRELRQALGLADDLLADAGQNDFAVRDQAARLLTNIGLNYFEQQPQYTDVGMNHTGQDRQLVAARTLWRRSLSLALIKRDSSFYLGTINGYLDHASPASAEADFAHLLNRLADRALRADSLAILGDAYFEAGRMNEARTRYAQSATAFSLPEIINYHALKGLGGL